MPARTPKLRPIAPSASPEEAAAVVAALERFMRATAPAAPLPAQPPDPWRATAVLEAVEREALGDRDDPWLTV